jgi:hypothetical protein
VWMSAALLVDQFHELSAKGSKNLSAGNHTTFRALLVKGPDGSVAKAFTREQLKLGKGNSTTGRKVFSVWLQESQSHRRRDEWATFLAAPSNSTVPTKTEPIGYLWDVIAPQKLVEELRLTRMGALYGPNGLCGVQQYLPNIDLHECFKMFFAPPVPGVILTPPHLDGNGFKAAVHFVLCSGCPAAFNTVQLWTPQQLGIDKYSSSGPDFLDDAKLQPWLQLTRMGTDGGSLNGDKEAWRFGPIVMEGQKVGVDYSLEELHPGQVLLMMPGVVHFFLKCLKDDCTNKDSLRAAMRNEPLVGVGCDTFTLGHTLALAEEQLILYDTSRSEQRKRKAAQSPTADDQQTEVSSFSLSLPLLFATLAFGEKMYEGSSVDDALKQESIRTLHFQAAAPYCKKLLDADEAAALNLPKSISIQLQPRSTEVRYTCSIYRHSRWLHLTALILTPLLLIFPFFSLSLSFVSARVWLLWAAYFQSRHYRHQRQAALRRVCRTESHSKQGCACCCGPARGNTSLLSTQSLLRLLNSTHK